MRGKGEFDVHRDRKSIRSLRKKFAILLRELKSALERHYGPRLVSVVIFGSVGRGKPRPDSDVDILIVADRLPDGRFRRIEEFSAVKRALARRLKSLEEDRIFTTLAPIFKTPQEVERGSLLFLDMIDDGEVLHDRSGFWVSYMKGFQERLRRLGAKKIVQGDRWYWDLKPDYKPGDIFEI